MTNLMKTSGQSPIRVFLIDDHALFREGLANVLSRNRDLEVTGSAESVAQAMRFLERQEVDLILLDVDLGSDRAIDFIHAARQAGIDSRILVVTAGIGDVEAVTLIRAGVAGIFHKHARPEELDEAIRRVAGGDVYLEQRYLKGLFANVDRTNGSPDDSLSDRERMVIRGLLQGLANKEIGEKIGLSESSVKSILRGLFDRFGVRTRSQLVKIALESFSNQI
jgi:two-component system, NarL family, nitrate/nitrite response regulator NarL